VDGGGDGDGDGGDVVVKLLEVAVVMVASEDIQSD